MNSYEPTDREKKQKEIPTKLNQYGNSYGNIEIGVNRKGILTISVQEKERYNSPVQQNATKRFQGNQSKFHSIGGSKYYYTSPGEAESAFVFTEDVKKTDQYIYRNMKRIFRKENNQVLEGTLPFLLPEEVVSHTERILHEQEERRFYQMFQKSVEHARHQRFTQGSELVYFEETKNDNNQDEEDGVEDNGTEENGTEETIKRN